MGIRTYDYIVTIQPKNNQHVFDWFSLMALFITVAAGIGTLIGLPDNMTKVGGIVSTALVAVLAIYSRITGSHYRLSLYFAALTWFVLMNNIWIGLLMIVLAFLEKQVKFKEEFGFDENGITHNTFPTKTYQWHEVSNVVIKDGILTIELLNNKIFQKEIDSEVTPVTEAEFNAFCKDYLFSFTSKA